MDIKQVVRVFRNLPNAVAQKEWADPRGGRYGERYMLPISDARRAIADEGSYFTACNPTPGTAIQLNANVTAFSDTNGFFVIKNTDQASNPDATRIYLDHLRLLLAGTAPTGTVDMNFAIKRSTIDREPTTTANRTVLTPVNMAGGAGRAAVARVMSYANAGAMTIPASLVSDPVLSRFRIPTSLGITGDEYLIKFGTDDIGQVQGLTAARATAVARIGAVAPPIVIEPGESVVIHMWWVTAATTAASFEFELAWYER